MQSLNRDQTMVHALQTKRASDIVASLALQPPQPILQTCLAAVPHPLDVRLSPDEYIVGPQQFKQPPLLKQVETSLRSVRRSAIQMPLTSLSLSDDDLTSDWSTAQLNVPLGLRHNATKTNRYRARFATCGGSWIATCIQAKTVTWTGTPAALGRMSRRKDVEPMDLEEQREQRSQSEVRLLGLEPRAAASPCDDLFPACCCSLRKCGEMPRRVCGCRPVTILVMILLGITGITAPITIVTSWQLTQASHQVSKLSQTANELEGLVQELEPLARFAHCIFDPKSCLNETTTNGDVATNETAVPADDRPRSHLRGGDAARTDRGGQSNQGPRRRADPGGSRCDRTGTEPRARERGQDRHPSGQLCHQQSNSNSTVYGVQGEGTWYHRQCRDIQRAPIILISDRRRQQQESASGQRLPVLRRGRVGGR